jgi:hypothetical protein
MAANQETCRAKNTYWERLANKFAEGVFFRVITHLIGRLIFQVPFWAVIGVSIFFQNTFRLTNNVTRLRAKIRMLGV